jgi:hypothetical protein
VEDKARRRERAETRRLLLTRGKRSKREQREKGAAEDNRLATEAASSERQVISYLASQGGHLGNKRLECFHIVGKEPVLLMKGDFAIIQLHCNEAEAKLGRGKGGLS